MNGAANYLLKHELTEKQLVEVLDQVGKNTGLFLRENRFAIKRDIVFLMKKDFRKNK